MLRRRIRFGKRRVALPLLRFRANRRQGSLPGQSVLVQAGIGNGKDAKGVRIVRFNGERSLDRADGLSRVPRRVVERNVRLADEAKRGGIVGLLSETREEDAQSFGWAIDSEQRLRVGACPRRAGQSRFAFFR